VLFAVPIEGLNSGVLKGDRTKIFRNISALETVESNRCSSKESKKCQVLMTVSDSEPPGDAGIIGESTQRCLNNFEKLALR